MSYNIKLEVFEGPMDLLLHLVQKEKIDIYQVSVSKIIDEYLDYISLLKELDINITSEFLVMASTLLSIKSKMLLPKREEPEEILDDEDEINSAEELLRRLDEYQKYKEVADILSQLEKEEKKVFLRPHDKEERETSLSDLSVDRLVLALQDMLKKKHEKEKVKILPREKITVEEMRSFIIKKIRSHKKINFIDLFSTTVSRLKIVTTFVALLELVKEEEVIIEQKNKFGNIMIQKKE